MKDSAPRLIDFLLKWAEDRGEGDAVKREAWKEQHDKLFDMSPKACNEVDRILDEHGPSVVADSPSEYILQVLTKWGAVTVHRNEGNTVDVDTLIEAGLYDPDTVKRIPAHDQLSEAIQACSEKRDEEMLWTIARAAKFLRVESLTRYAAQEAVLANNHFMTELAARPEVYYYVHKKGIYSKNGARKIGGLVNANIPDASADLIMNIVAKITAHTQVEWEAFETPSLKICVKNGILDLNPIADGGAPVLEPHSPDVVFLSRINVTYDENASCPLFDKFLSEIHHPEDIPAIEEIYGRMLDVRPIYQFIPGFLGDGGNGKSTAIGVIRKWLGKGNYSSVSLHYLLNKPFELCNLYGMHVNICSDASDFPLKNTGVIKSLAGGDEISAGRKFRSPIEFVWGGTLILAMNKAPVTPDVSYAMWRRIKLFQFPNRFEDNAPGTDNLMMDKLTTEDELSGILNLAIRGLSRLLANNFCLSYTKTPEEVEHMWNTSADPVMGFVDARLERYVDDEPTKDDVWQVYHDYCIGRKVRPRDSTQFAKELRRVCPELRDTKKQVGSKRVPMWVGIRIKDTNNGRTDEDNNKKQGRPRTPLLAFDNGPPCPGTSDKTQVEKVSDLEEVEPSQPPRTEGGKTDPTGTPTARVEGKTLAEQFNVKVGEISSKACIAGFDYERDILKRAISIVAEIILGHDTPAAWALSRRLHGEYPQHAFMVKRLVAGYYAEILEAATLLTKLGKLVVVPNEGGGE